MSLYEDPTIARVMARILKVLDKGPASTAQLHQATVTELDNVPAFSQSQILRLLHELARFAEPSNSRVTDNYVELKRTDGSTTVLRIVWQMLPRNGGRSLFLFCPYCNTPRRHV